MRDDFALFQCFYHRSVSLMDREDMILTVLFEEKDLQVVEKEDYWDVDRNLWVCRAVTSRKLREPVLFWGEDSSVRGTGVSKGTVQILLDGHVWIHRALSVCRVAIG